MIYLEKLKNEIRIIGKKRLMLAVLFLMVLLVIFYLRNKGILDIEKIVYFLKNHQFSSFLFILVYAFMIAFLIPTLPMNLGAGFMWGGFLGGVISLISTSLGAIISFFVSRYLFHDYFNNRFNNKFWTIIRERMRKNDWKIIVFTRINPAFPFALTSYFFGLSPVSFLKFILSTVIPIIPPAFLFAYVGHSIGGIILGESFAQILKKIIIISLLLIFVVVFYFIFKHYFQQKNENNFISTDIK